MWRCRPPRGGMCFCYNVSVMNLSFKLYMQPGAASRIKHPIGLTFERLADRGGCKNHDTSRESPAAAGAGRPDHIASLRLQGLRRPEAMTRTGLLGTVAEYKFIFKTGKISHELG